MSGRIFLVIGMLIGIIATSVVFLKANPGIISEYKEPLNNINQNVRSENFQENFQAGSDDVKELINNILGTGITQSGDYLKATFNRDLPLYSYGYLTKGFSEFSLKKYEQEKKSLVEEILLDDKKRIGGGLAATFSEGNILANPSVGQFPLNQVDPVHRTKFAARIALQRNRDAYVSAIAARLATMDEQLNILKQKIETYCDPDDMSMPSANPDKIRIEGKCWGGGDLHYEPVVKAIAKLRQSLCFQTLLTYHSLEYLKQMTELQLIILRAEFSQLAYQEKK